MAFFQHQLRRTLTSFVTSPSLLRTTTTSLQLSSLPIRSFSILSSTRPILLSPLPTLSTLLSIPSTTRSFTMPKAIRKKVSALARPKKTARRASARKAKRRSKRMNQPN